MHFKEDIITFFLVVAALLFFAFTPGKETLGSAVQGFIIATIFFGLLPLGYHFLVLKKSPGSLALESGSWKKGWLWVIPALLGALFVTGIAYWLLPQFQTAVILPPGVEKSFQWFVIYELILVPILVFLYELFFRGLVQKNWLEKYWGAGAIFAQSGLFLVFLLMTGSFGWAMFPFIVFSLFSGFLVWKNNSLLQAWFAGWLYLLIFDITLLFLR